MKYMFRVHLLLFWCPCFCRGRTKRNRWCILAPHFWVRSRLSVWRILRVFGWLSVWNIMEMVVGVKGNGEGCRCEGQWGWLSVRRVGVECYTTVRLCGGTIAQFYGAKRSGDGCRCEGYGGVCMRVVKTNLWESWSGFGWTCLQIWEALVGVICLCSNVYKKNMYIYVCVCIGLGLSVKMDRGVSSFFVSVWRAKASREPDDHLRCWFLKYHLHSCPLRGCSTFRFICWNSTVLLRSTVRTSIDITGLFRQSLS